MTAFKYVDDVFLSAWLVLSGTGWLCMFPFFHHLLFSHSFCPSLFSCSYWNKRQKKAQQPARWEIKAIPLSLFIQYVWVCPSMSPCVCCDIIIPLPPPGHYRLRRTCSGSISLWSEHLLSLTLQTVEEAFGFVFFQWSVFYLCSEHHVCARAPPLHPPALHRRDSTPLRFFCEENQRQVHSGQFSKHFV